MFGVKLMNMVKKIVLLLGNIIPAVRLTNNVTIQMLWVNFQLVLQCLEVIIQGWAIVNAGIQNNMVNKTQDFTRVNAISREGRMKPAKHLKNVLLVMTEMQFALNTQVSMHRKYALVRRTKRVQLQEYFLLSDLLYLY